MSVASPSAQAPIAGPASPQRALRARARRFRRVPWQIAPFAVVLIGIVLVAILAPAVAPQDPTRQALRERLAPPMAQGAAGAHWLGTDQLGRDVLSRVIVGSRISLLVGAAGLVLGGVFGSLVGLLAGYWRGWVDQALMAVADIQLAFPAVLLAIAVIAVLGPNLLNLVLVLGLTGWVTYARVARAAVLKLRSEEFVEAVRCIGGGSGRIVFRHLLPNVVSILIVVATLQLSRIVILESTLSFLGLGVQPPTPSWGSMISEGNQFLNTAWWIAVAPGAALFLLTMSVNRIGDWLRDVLDPTLRAGA